MESFRILALLCLVSGFSIVNANAQMSSKLKYNLSNGSTTNKPIYNLDTSFSHKNSINYLRTTGLSLPWQDIRETPNSVFLSPGSNFDELLKTSIDNCIRLAGESSFATSSGTFNGKWERLTGKSIIDTSRVYYLPLKSTSNPTFSDNQFYRTGASIFNMLVSTKYPYLTRLK